MPHTTAPKNIAAIVREARKSKNLTQEQVAAATNDAVSQSTVSDIEIGRVDLFRLEAYRFLALLEALGLEFSEVAPMSKLQREYPSELPVLSMLARGKPIPDLMQPAIGIDIEMNHFVHCYLVETDSMAPSIERGERIFIDTSKAMKQPSEGKIFVFDTDAGYDLARAREVDNKFILIPDNPTHKTYSWASVSIIGRATESIQVKKL